MADTLAIAQWLARNGMHVFGVDHPDLPQCAGLHKVCDGDRGKHPDCKWGTAASKDPQAVAAMFAGRTRNIGIACGPSRLVVVDEDAAGELDRLAAQYGATVPVTFAVMTSNGRRHFYFWAPDGTRIGNTTGLLGFAIDIRGDGGFVVAPGSKHVSGAIYAPVDPSVPVAPLPGWLAALLVKFEQPAGSMDVPKVERSGRIEWHTRDDTLFEYACSLRGRNLDRAEAEALMRQRWSECAQPPGDCGNPRCTKPHDEFTWEAALVKLDQAWRYPPGKAAQPAPVAVDTATSDGFWTARPILAHVHQFALARRASPWATLGVVLARAACVIEPYVMLPPLIGTHASLNLFVGLVGPSAAGKDSAIGAAIDAVDMGEIVTAGAGSGQGIAHMFASYRKPKQGEPGGVEQHTSCVLFEATEVDTLASLTRQQGSATLLPELRKAWTGARLGFAYVDKDKRLHLPAHSYRLALVAGIQPERAGILLDEAARASGTPQRFLWLPATNPDAPDVPPVEPAPATFTRPWRPVDLGLPMRSPSRSERIVLPVCQTARDTVDAAYLARHRNQADVLDGHALLCRLKTAAVLSLLDVIDGRRDAGITEQDWELAGVIQAVSDRTRAGVVRALDEARRKANQARGEQEADRAVIVRERSDDAAIQRVCRVIMRRLDGAGWVSRSDLRRTITSQDRGCFDPAIVKLSEAGQIEPGDRTYQGQPTHYRKINGGQP